METKKRRKRRSKEDIEEIIINTATKLITEKGFIGVTVTAIIQEAQIEPVQFYHRYQDLNHLISEYVKKYDYWFSDIIEKFKVIVDDKEQYKAILNNLFESLCDNRIMQQLLRWELSNNNETSQRTAKLREVHTYPLTEKYEKIFSSSPIDVVAISSLIVAGMYYLILHSELSEFSGIDIRTEIGRKRIHNTIDYIANTIFSDLHKYNSVYEIASKMKQKGIDVNTIEECTNIPQNIIKLL